MASSRNHKPQTPNDAQRRFNAPKFGKPDKGPSPEPLGKIRPRHSSLDPTLIGASENRYRKYCFNCERELEAWEHPVCCTKEVQS
jgi:hypothetical protein